MSGPSDKDGVEGHNAHPPGSGLDAKLDRAVPTGDAEAFLLGVGGFHGGRVYPLSHNTVFLGRADDADVCVSDPSVSVQHARIINGSQGFEIEDLDSTNGTFVEGNRVIRTRLQSGDRVKLGQVEFKFLVDRRMDATMTVIPAGAPRWPLVRYAPPRPSERAIPPPSAMASSRDEDQGPSLTEIIGRAILVYRFLRRNLALIALFTIAGAVAGLGSVLVIPVARETVCLVKLQPQVKVNPVDSQWMRPSQTPDNDDGPRFFAGAEVAFVQPGLVADTLRKLQGREPDNAVLTSIVERLKFEPLPDHVYKAIYREKSFGKGLPEGFTFLAAHLENYLNGEISRGLRVFTAQADFLRNQLTSVENEMKQLSDQKVKFSEKNADRLPEEGGLMIGSRFELETHRAELVAQVRRLQGELEAQRHALAAEGPLAQSRLQSSQSYRESLAGLNRKLSEAYARGLADGHPEVRQLKDEKQRIEALIEKEMRSETNQLDRGSNAGYQDLQHRIALLQAQLSAARSDLADTEANLGRIRHVVGDLPRVQERVQQLAHTQEATTHLHGQLFEQLKKAELQLNLERVSAESRYEIISPPEVVKPGRLRTGVTRTGLGLAIGLLLASVILAVREGRRIVSQTLATMDSRQSPSNG